MTKSSKTCSVPKCEGKHYGRGMCWKHYLRMRRHGTTDLLVRPPEQCSVQACEEKPYGNGLCNKHWQRVRRHGDTDLLKGPARQWIDQLNTRTKFPDECIDWPFWKDYQGYGRISNKENRRGMKDRATHVILESSGKPRPSKAFALHSCDNPSCVNPNHLRWGTHQDNTDDMCSRRRQAYGERNGTSKLTEMDVRHIRVDTRSQRVVGRDYGVAQSTISQIKSKRLWKHI